MKSFVVKFIFCGVVVLSQYVFSPGQVGGTLDLNQAVTIRTDHKPLGEVLRQLNKNYAIGVGLELSQLDADHDDFNFETNFPPVVEDRIERDAYTITNDVEPSFEAKKYTITVDANQRPLREVLDAVVNQMKNYRWEISEGVVNIIPTKGRDKRYMDFLALSVKHLSLGKKRPPVSLIRQKIMALPEVTAFLAENSLRFASTNSGFVRALNREFEGDLEYADITMRQLLNTIARSNKGGWILSNRRSIKTSTEYIDLDI
jgi:hypothetical protein